MCVLFIIEQRIRVCRRMTIRRYILIHLKHWTAILNRHWVTLVSLKAWCWMPVKWNPYIDTDINQEFLERNCIQSVEKGVDWNSYLCLEGLETSSRRLRASSSCARVLGGGRGGMAGSWTKGCAGWCARRCALLPPPPQVCVRVESKQCNFFTFWVLQQQTIWSCK